MMRVGSLVVFLSVVTYTVVNANSIGGSWPQVTGLQITNASKKAHHTEHYKIKLGFAVRRGQPFDVIITTSEELKYRNMTFLMSVDEKESTHSPEFTCQLKKKIGATKYLVQVNTAGACPVGKYEDITLSVVEVNKDGDIETKEEDFEYFYPFPVYVLFNPWSKEDKCVYMEEENERQEYVIHEYGKVYDGSINEYRAIHWYYGQFNQVALDAVFYLLKTIPRSNARSALLVAQHISQTQGFHDPNPGEKPCQGNKDGLLEGKWSGDFSDGTDPDLWVSTIDILNMWKETGRPAKYGQCWVFAALQNTLMRTIGIPSRQLSAFGARIDATAKTSKDHLYHHVVDRFYEKDGSLHHSIGSVWNYHSWNNIWLHRAGNSYSGWQNEDGTPPGLGPASLKATLLIEDSRQFNVSDLISTVHSTLRDFLVTCTKADEYSSVNTDLKGCTIGPIIKYDHKGTGLILTTHTREDGSLEELDITRQFVDPAIDAFIPFPGDTVTPEYNNRVGYDDVADFEVQVEDQGMVIVGKPVTGVVNIQTISVDKDFKVNIAIDLVNRRGDIIKLISRSSHSKVSSGAPLSVPFNVDAQQYIQKRMIDHVIQVRAVVHSDGVARIVTKIIAFDAPEIKLTVPSNVLIDSYGVHTFFPVEAHFTNPHGFELQNVCLTIHSHELSFQNEDLGSKHTRCMDLPPGASVELKTSLKTGNELRLHHTFATVQGDFMPIGYKSESVNHIDI
eukprot:CFRG1045T1